VLITSLTGLILFHLRNLRTFTQGEEKQRNELLRIAIGLDRTTLLLFLLLFLALFPFPLLFLLLAILFGRNILGHALSPLRIHLVLHLLFPVFPRLALLGVLAQKVFSALDLQVDLALLLWGRERRVNFLSLIRDSVWYSSLAE
jgi:hypothetical protein